MSSLVDAVINSSGLPFDSDIPSDLPYHRPADQSLSRPRGPPSESHGHRSDDEGFPDDEVVGVRGTVGNRPRQPMDRAIPRVVDVTGETVQQNFEEFLEQCVPLDSIRFM